MKYNNIPVINKILGVEIGEIFVDITPQYIPGIYPYYMISNCGNVYHKALGRLVSLGISTSGYWCYPFATDHGAVTTQIHRLEMVIFNYIPGCEYLDVNHKNGNKLDNHLYNMEWMTRQENIIHSYRIGLHVLGEDSPLAKITNDDAIKICELLQLGYGPKEISEMIGIRREIIQSIKNRDTWTHISCNYIFPEQRKSKSFSDEDVNAMCKFFSSNDIGNLTIKDYCKIALVDIGLETTNKNVDSARKIYTRTHYTRISKDYIF